MWVINDKWGSSLVNTGGLAYGGGGGGGGR